MSDNKSVVSITVITPEGEKTYQVGKSEFVFGRGSKADVIVSDVGISREHLKIRVQHGQLYVMDIKSLNGTFVNGHKMRVGEFLPVENNSSISFGKSRTKIEISLQKESVSRNASNDYHGHLPPPPKGLISNDQPVQVPGFSSTEEDFKLSFKEVGLPEPKPRSSSAQAKALIEEAQFQKKTILQNAEVQKLNLINEAKILSKRAQDQALQQYQKMVDDLLSQTKFDLNHLRSETESELNDKRLKANEEIKGLWVAHEEQLEEDRKNRMLELEKENQVKLELEIEKAKTDLQIERNKLLDSAALEIERQRNDFAMQISKFEERLNDIKNQTSENHNEYENSKQRKKEAEIELSEVVKKLAEENEKYSELDKKLSDLKDENSEFLKRVTELKDNENNIAQNVKNLESERDSLKASINALSEKKQNLENELDTVLTNLKDTKAKAKAEIETEFANLKAQEAQKFSEYKTHELKELQKVRDSHAEAIRKMSIELSQEITTKLELLASKSGYSQFNFEQNFEMINSTIEFKNTVQTGDEANHAQSLENWKNRKKREDNRLLATGFAVAVVVMYLGNFIYDRLKVDPAKLEMQRIAKENALANQANKYIPVKSDQYYDNYVESVLYTDNFYETYMDENNQREWVNHATKYFLRQWHIEEEKVIKVISNSKALIQNVSDEVPRLKKTKLKADLARLKELEETYIKQQSDILGTNVKYEAYKKIEKDFFNSRIKNRLPAGK